MGRTAGGIKLLFLVLFVSLFILLIGCRFDYGEEPPSDLREDPPDSILKGVVYEVHMPDQSKIVFTGEHAEFYDDRQLSILTDVTFFQYNQKGEALTEGKAHQAEIDLHTEDALLTGDVVVTAKEEDLVITAPRLYWEREREILSSAPSDIVTIKQSDGTMMQGKQFTGDLYRRSFEFAEEAEGVLYE